MHKGRLEAFSDGVLAIIITIMVLELKVPHGEDLATLLKLWPVFLSYVLSFIFVGIYWNNHHHMFQVVKHVDGRVLWANLHLLFWLSLIPFASGWMGENHFGFLPVFLYGVLLLGCAVAYTILVRALLAINGGESALAKAIGSDRKGYLSLAIYAAALLLAFVSPSLSMACYVLVALIWLVPDRRMAKVLDQF
jgi:uncharacterized membrane protein